MIHDSSVPKIDAFTLKQYPSSKFPKSSQPPYIPVVAINIGFILARANVFTVRVKSFLRDVNE